jgi:ribokinase
MGPGGKGSNQAVGTARLGAKSYFIGIIGNDKLGEIATDLYAGEGVDTTYLEKSSKMATGVGFIILNHAGENGIILDMSANELMDAAYVAGAEKQIAASDIVMSVLEIPVAAAVEAMRLGKKHGVRTLLNPAPATALPEEVFQNIDILTPNETELRILLGLKPDDPTPTVELAQRLKALGVETIVITMGGDGSLVLTGDQQIRVPAIPIEVVDSTGAGDAFNSGLAVALASGKDLIEAVKFGNCYGALACTKLGVIPSMATREQAEQLYQQHYS